MRIAIVCYPTYGGSGVVATELGLALARRGHQVHFISYELPFRLSGVEGDVWFHSVDVPTYPLFKYPPYMVALASKVYEVATIAGLDVVHVHYAIPHAIAGYLARQMLDGRVRLVTTLHGTDITLLGSEPGFAPAVTFSINHSDAVTAVSQYLADETNRMFPIRVPIDVIANFIDPEVYRPQPDKDLRLRFAPPQERIVIHVSNFRPVKQPQTVVEVFARSSRTVPSRLLLVGDGPELCTAFQAARDLGVADRVYTLGNRDDIVSLLSISDVFLLPSLSESFGLAALEAMACGLPVVASAVGGLPEVVVDGQTGWLLQPSDVVGMAERLSSLLTDDKLRARMGRSARNRAVTVFPQAKWVDEYERVYEAASTDQTANSGDGIAGMSQEPC